MSCVCQKYLTITGITKAYVTRPCQRRVGGLAQWVMCLTCTQYVVNLSPIKGSRYIIEQETLFPCLVLVGSRNGFERDLNRQKMVVSQSN